MITLEQKDHQALIDKLVAAGTQYIEANQPELKGDAKKAAVIDAVEKKILDVYNGVDTFIYDFPPFVDLAVSIGVPHLTETLDLVRALRPVVEDSIERMVSFFNSIGWFGGAK